MLDFCGECGLMKITIDRLFSVAFVSLVVLSFVEPVVPARYMKKMPEYQKEAGIVYRALRGESVGVDELSGLRRRRGDKALAAALADKGVTQAELDRFFEDPRYWYIQKR